MKFPWKKLQQKKLGIWYKNFKFKSKGQINKKNVKSFYKNLFKIGYRYFDQNKRTSKDALIVKAFQRRFLPREITGQINEKTYIISQFLAIRSKN